MSKIFNESNILCPCHCKTGEDLNPHFLKHLSYLYFCPSCQAVKCEECCAIHVESKFCPSCLSVYSSNESHCMKSCFNCPKCSSKLSVTVLPHMLNQREAKFFNFNCVYCKYNYSSEPVLKPRPVFTIVKEDKQKNDSSTNMFNDIYNNMINREKLNVINQNDYALSPDIINKLEIMGIKKVSKFNPTTHLQDSVNKNELVAINPTEDFSKASQVAIKDKMSDFMNVKQRCKNGNISNDSSILYPIATTLIPKKSLKCLMCNNNILTPNVDTIKYDVKWNAVDFLPTLHLSNPDDEEPDRMLEPGVSYTFLISLTNPLSEKADIKLSYISKLGKSFISSADIQADIYILATEVSLGPSHNLKDLIKSIPTSFLTKKTMISRSEISLRREAAIKSGVNDWCLIPLNFTATFSKNIKAQNVDIYVPLYITVTSELPDKVREMETSKEQLKFGYWNIIKLGVFSIG
ncbi:uncharacterized protein PRCAT00001118001 [Priceomyces carsonii]|uniref:uncharacterized protein n=1 Tax=Priceomyces carsonii TaxID=28549 RepID=UPI002ED96A52|nr:unnamed protein product [Priceomyces carsonii]